MRTQRRNRPQTPVLRYSEEPDLLSKNPALRRTSEPASAKRISAFAAAMLLLLSVAALKADVTTQPTTAPAAASIDTLIKQLGNDSADDRNSAQKQLVDLGPSAVSALKKAADDSDDPEIRSRAAAALAQMKDIDANGVSLITLHMKDAPASDVLSAVGAQCHTQFQGIGQAAASGHPGPTLSLDVDHKPFWEVVENLSGQLNACPRTDTQVMNTMQLIATPRNWMTQSQHEIVGPYWVNLAGIYHTRSLDMLGATRVADDFVVRLMVMAEPKLAVTQMSEFVIKEAKDDAGNSLMLRADAVAANQLLRSARQLNHTVESRLSYPDNPGKKIAILRGEVTAMLAQDVQQFVVDDVLTAPKVTSPLTGCKVQATVVPQGTTMYRVTITCTRDGLNDDQWTAMMNRLNDVSLEDADGHALTGFPTGMQLATGTPDATFTTTTTFNRNAFGGMLPMRQQVNALGPAKKLIWNVATSVKPVVIPVTFKDLPMP